MCGTSSTGVVAPRFSQCPQRILSVANVFIRCHSQRLVLLAMGANRRGTTKDPGIRLELSVHFVALLSR